MPFLRKIISGGQTGADQGALYAARELKLETGGWAPKGYRTDKGSDYSLQVYFNLQEHSSFSYPPRTLRNIQESDATLIFGNHFSPGCKLTKKYCKENNKPYILVTWPYHFYNKEDNIEKFKSFIEKEEILILNLAGNRESNNPGIFEAVKLFLITALK